MNHGRIPIGVDDCPDPEWLAAYLDGTLDPHEREAVERHAATCHDCRLILADARALLDEAEAVPEPLPIVADARVLPFRRWRAGGIAVAAVAAALLLTVRLAPQWLPWSSGRADAAVAELIQTVNALPARPFEARLSGEVTYRPAPVVLRGAANRNVPPDLQIAASRVALAATGQDASDRAARGFASLTTGDIDPALADLEAAAAVTPAVARTLNDLAAAYLARAASTSGRADYQKALQTADRAIQAAPAMPEALFNRALALDGLGDKDGATRAWQAYLAVDRDSPWAAEVRQRCPRC